MADQLGADAPVREESPDLDEEVDHEVDLFAPQPGDEPDSSAFPEGPSDRSSPHGDAGGAASSDGARANGVTSTPSTASSVSVSAATAATDRQSTSAGASADDHSDSALSGFRARLGIRAKGQIRARKVQRIVRRVDPWSVLKLSLLFYFCVWLMVMVALVLIWGTAMSSGTVGSLESFIAEFLAFEEFKFNGDQLFQIFALGGLIGVFVATAATAVLAVLFNLIADLTGGIRFTVVEEESARRIVNPR